MSMLKTAAAGAIGFAVGAGRDADARQPETQETGAEADGQAGQNG